jgi:hypothetical protein
MKKAKKKKSLWIRSTVRPRIEQYRTLINTINYPWSRYKTYYVVQTRSCLGSLCPIIGL